MVRKPQPKDAAKAIQALFIKAGFQVQLGTCQEAVAIVEGYETWNALSALLPQKGKKEQRSPVPEAKTNVEDGPFRVLCNGGYYDSYLHFKYACDAASAFSGDLDSANVCEVVNQYGTVVATYIGDHMLHQAMVVEWDSLSSKTPTPAWDDSKTLYFGHPDNMFDYVVEQFDEATGEGSESTVIAMIRSFDTDADGLVLRAPNHIVAFEVVGGCQFRFGTQLPQDIQDRMMALHS